MRFLIYGFFIEINAVTMQMDCYDSVQRWYLRKQIDMIRMAPVDIIYISAIYFRIKIKKTRVKDEKKRCKYDKLGSKTGIGSVLVCHGVA